MPRLAVLIDGENVSHRLAPRIFAMIEPLGFAPARAVYGDFSGPAASWGEAAAHHAIEPRHVFPTAKGKNTADIALTIDAMDLLRDGATDGFCIVSSDGDFAGLARRIRAEGRDAYGLGCHTATERCRAAFTRFLLLDAEEGARAPSHAALPAIRAALAECPLRDGWYWLADFGSCARQRGLTPEAFGAASFSKLLTATGQFVVEDNQRFRLAPPLRLVGADQ